MADWTERLTLRDTWPIAAAAHDIIDKNSVCLHTNPFPLSTIHFINIAIFFSKQRLYDYLRSLRLTTILHATVNNIQRQLLYKIMLFKII